MIVLDTNVLSELLRHGPDPVVALWLNNMPMESIWTTAITVFEIRLGLEVMATGRKRKQLEEQFAKVITEDIEGRVLPLDAPSADAAGVIAAERRRVGRTVEIRDVQIAGIVTARKATLATRNVRHFHGIGLSLIDPWAD